MKMMMTAMMLLLKKKHDGASDDDDDDDDEDDDDDDKHLLHPPLEVFPPSILLCPGQRFQQLPERHYHHVNHHRVTV